MIDFSMQPKWASRLFDETKMWHTQALHGLATHAAQLGGGIVFGIAGWLLPLWTFVGSFAFGFVIGGQGMRAFYYCREFGVPVLKYFVRSLEGAHRYYKRERRLRGPTYQRDLEVHLWDSKSDFFFPSAVADTPLWFAFHPDQSGWWMILVLLWTLVWLNALCFRPHPDLVVDGMR